MKFVLIIVLGAIVYASRAIGLAFMPDSAGRLQAILERLPGPLFAALAVVALVNDAGAIRSTTSVVAALFALAVTPTRSLPLIFAAGITGYLAGTLLGL
jgi:hypothetical protein